MKIVAAAIKTKDGVVHFLPAPNRHHHIREALHIKGGEPGFILDNGTFATRVEAGKEALKSGQVKALSNPPDLYSEDLW